MTYRIKGGESLRGSITVSGSKNAALPILFASLLAEDEVTLFGVPNIGDIKKTLALFGKMGACAHLVGDTLKINARHLYLPGKDEEEISALRATSYLLGVGLSRFGGVRMTYPGGCNFGTRPLDIHRNVFEALGAVWKESEAGIAVSAKRLHGSVIDLRYPSVGATVNALLAAVGAEGETVIRGYAGEGHITSLLRFLRKMGADITVHADAITVRGGKKLHGCSFTVPPDEIEAATFLIGGALLRSEISVCGISPAALSPLLTVFGRMGISYALGERSVTVLGGDMRPVNVSCAPYPAFPTDLQPLLAVLLSSAKGGKITDRVWRGRFSYVGELAKMGFSAREREGSLRIFPSRLYASRLRATDLRGGAAMVLAALAARGESLIENTVLIERGYEHFLEKWKTLGASVERF